ncbi:energy transducer TonB [Campylobacter hyointestinalis]|uniref:energy transducer TonB n=1 Tax=Campylobacter hyointestinalis TaxID=198 RepID=UPI000DCD8226|nr:energy transducer TonB [Campylobacter hyointestinalis]RAZ54307.1 energy transducer TonB [Campylobacter hyointestinalis subsp. lawsonii]RAZ62702.1 energy transducer TonB [Campylobacter hyointestinalis subsp. lawsonii]
MRYFLLSFVLNLAILFLPLHSGEAQKPSKNITIKLNETKEQEYPKIEPKPKNQPKTTKKVEKMEQISQKPKIEPKIKNTTPKSNPKPKNQSKTTKKVEKMEQISQKPSQNSLEKSQIPNKTTQTNESKSNKDICTEGVGFLITNKIEPTYPKKALLLRLKESFRVEVEFQINKDGSIKILNINSNSEIFNDEAVKLTKKLGIKVLKDEVTNCKIIKPYEFKFER